MIWVCRSLTHLAISFAFSLFLGFGMAVCSLVWGLISVGMIFVTESKQTDIWSSVTSRFEIEGTVPF